MKKTNNGGFSLVELIIVIAIMAILVGVLAPQYLKYVEKSRRSADLDTLDGVYTACTTAASDSEVTDAPSSTATMTTVASSGSWGAEVVNTVGCDINALKFKSKSAGQATGCTVEYNATSNIYTVIVGSLSVTTGAR